VTARHGDVLRGRVTRHTPAGHETGSPGLTTDRTSSLMNASILAAPLTGTGATPHRGRPPRVAVVGGGISGLAAAHRLVELSREQGSPVEVSLLEAGPRLGGVIHTGQRDGFLLEWGPEAFLTEKPQAMALARRLGLGDRIIGTREEFRRSFVVRKGRLRPVPEGFQLLAPSRLWPLVLTPIFSPLGKLRMGLDLLVPPRRDGKDESLSEFVTRRLGRETLERLAEPMVAGIYGADPKALSLKATFPRFLEMERKYGSIIRAMLATRFARRKTAGASGAEKGTSGARYSLFATFDSGMQTLTDALAARLPPGSARAGAAVQALARHGNRWTLALGNGESVEANAVILAVPAHGAASLLSPLDADLGRLLERIPYASSATLNLAYRREDIPHPLDGFGFVVPRAEGLTILGCTFSSVKFAGRAPEGHALLRAFLGDGAFSASEEDILQATLVDLRQLLGVTKPPLWHGLARWPRAMPHYTVGHIERVAEMGRRAAEFPGLALAGNAYTGIGIPDSIGTGERAAEAMLSFVTSPR
jgi:protoporphyrinogen/coproporphyrinogen III oxidase